jgi:hypothetical protein
MPQSSASSVASSVDTHKLELGKRRTALDIRGLSLLFMSFQTLGMYVVELFNSSFAEIYSIKESYILTLAPPLYTF